MTTSIGQEARRRKEPASPKIGNNLDAAYDLETDGVYRSVEYSNAVMTSLEVEAAEVEEARFVHAQLSGSQLERVIFTDAKFEDNCDLANLTSTDSSLIRVEVTRGRLTGLTWTNGVFRDVTFDDCQMKLAAFRFTKFKGAVVFKDCDLATANFQNADLGRASFVRCDLSGAQFSNAVMKGAYFENCNLDGLIGVTSFDGATIRSSDLYSLAHSLASALGITIE